jgi:hypothetical protein
MAFWMEQISYLVPAMLGKGSSPAKDGDEQF